MIKTNATNAYSRLIKTVKQRSRLTAEFGASERLAHRIAKRGMDDGELPECARAYYSY